MIWNARKCLDNPSPTSGPSHVFFSPCPACVDRSLHACESTPEFLRFFNVWKSYGFINFDFLGFWFRNPIPNQTFPTTEGFCEEISCLNTGIKTYQLSTGWVELSCLPEFWWSSEISVKKSHPQSWRFGSWSFDDFFLFWNQIRFESPFRPSRALKISTSHVQPAPSGNDRISHQTVKGNSSTETCQTVGDMYPFPRGYSGGFFSVYFVAEQKNPLLERMTF